MHNPLVLFSIEALDQLRKEEHYYFVRQSYPRGMKPSFREAFLITPYVTLEDAQKHYDAIKFDKRKWLYNIGEDKLDSLSVGWQLERLYTAATQPEGYLVYLNHLKDKEWKVPDELVSHIKKYIRRNTSWKPGGGQEINVTLSLQFGHFIIKLQYGGDKLQVPLDEVEKL